MTAYLPFRLPGMPPPKLRPQDEEYLALQQQMQQGQPPAHPALAGMLPGAQPAAPPLPEVQIAPGTPGPQIIEHEGPLAGGLMGYPTRQEIEDRQRRVEARMFLEASGYDATPENMQSFLDHQALVHQMQDTVEGQVSAFRGGGVMGAEALASQSLLAGQEQYGRIGDYGGVMLQEVQVIR